MDLEKQLEQLITSIAVVDAWMIIAAIAALTFKNTIQRFVEGMMFFFGSDFAADDIVYINGTKKARIIRQGFTKTTFYVYGTNRKLIIRNDKLPHLMLEKTLPQNGDNNENHQIKSKKNH